MQSLDGGGTGSNGRDSRNGQPSGTRPSPETPEGSGGAHGSLMQRYRGTGAPPPAGAEARSAEVNPPLPPPRPADPSENATPTSAERAWGEPSRTWVPGSGPAPGSGTGAGTSTGAAAPARPATPPGTGPGSGPPSGSGAATRPGPAPGAGTAPGSGSSAGPTTAPGTGTAPGTATGPGAGTGTAPGSGSSAGPAGASPTTAPGTGSATTPGTATGPGAGTGTAPGSGSSAPGSSARPAGASPTTAPAPSTATTPGTSSTWGTGSATGTGQHRDGAGDRAAVTRGVTPGTGTSTGPTLSAEQTAEFKGRWRDVQSDFVDDPQQAVRGADALAREVLDALAARIADKQRVDGWKAGDGSGTEDLRLALRQYRSLVDKLLEL